MAKMKSLIKKWQSALLAGAGSFMIAAGWSWYHIRRRPHLKFVLMALAIWAAAALGYAVFKKLYGFLVSKFNRHQFWQNEFKQSLDGIFLVFSLFFLVFFSRNEILSLVWFLAVLFVFYFKLQKEIKKHPGARPWLDVNKNLFILTVFLFSLLSVFQFIGYKYSIFDANIKFYNIVLFRSVAMTMFWILGFSVCSLLYWKIRSKWRYTFLFLWGFLFFLAVAVWLVNIGLLYFSGLYLNPLMLGFLEGSSSVVFNRLTILILAGGFIVLALFGLVFRQVIIAHQKTPKRQWLFYNFSLIAISLFSLLALGSFKNTPEYFITRSFYNYFRGSEAKAEISPVILAKLKKFGLNYNLEKFNITVKDKIYSDQKPLLPGKFAKSKPNIIIVFLESFSSRLTGVYNSRFSDLTPGLQKMAGDKNTTVFKKYYNASTPTVTGLLSQLCSFLPPTGHNEIQEEKKIQRIRLSCLPKILMDNQYEYSVYITAVSKDFANKGSLFASMGTQEFYGTEDLKNIISGEPLSWGYSDHQLFPALEKIIKEKAKSPFLAMLSTVDTHPPFNLAKDAVKYGDGKNDVLNSFHTTDDAFGIFWDQFKNSEYKDNTIVVAVADHAIFPGALTKDIFPQEAGNLSFYDENVFMTYIPDSVLPKEVDVYSSGLDFAPTILQILGINVSNSFEGHSIFDVRAKYPNLLGMHEFGLYINQDNGGRRMTSYAIPSEIECGGKDSSSSVDSPLTLCEYSAFYKWKRQMFEEGRLWNN